MIFENTIMGKLLVFFYRNSYEELYLRQLSKRLRLSTFSVKTYADELVKEGILLETRRGKERYLKASNNLTFRYLKIAYNLHNFLSSAIIDYLKEKIAVLSSVVIYGSIARGEDTENSDLDLLIIGQKVRLDLKKFEEKLGREIIPLFFKFSEWKKQAKENRGFYQNVIVDGIVVYGSMPVIE
jgi:predicted nucleotidyltransferase